MMRRVCRYPPPNARLIRLEEGPPTYRFLGYADKNNENFDLCNPKCIGYFGPFAFPSLKVNQSLPIGPGRFGLPSHPLPYTTTYWDPVADDCNRNCAKTMRISRRQENERPKYRLDIIDFPQRAIPGIGRIISGHEIGPVCHNSRRTNLCDMR